jgi:hypothetical protein
VPNNPFTRRASLKSPPAGIRITRRTNVQAALVVNNKNFTNPELPSPSGGPVATFNPSGGGGRGGDGAQLN